MLRISLVPDIMENKYKKGIIIYCYLIERDKIKVLKTDKENIFYKTYR